MRSWWLNTNMCFTCTVNAVVWVQRTGMPNCLCQDQSGASASRLISGTCTRVCQCTLICDRCCLSVLTLWQNRNVCTTAIIIIIIITTATTSTITIINYYYYYYCV